MRLDYTKEDQTGQFVNGASGNQNGRSFVVSYYPTSISYIDYRPLQDSERYFAVTSNLENKVVIYKLNDFGFEVKSGFFPTPVKYLVSLKGINNPEHSQA